MSERHPCFEGGGTHTWVGDGLDVDSRGRLVAVRHCVWCSREQSKPYGAGSRRAWGAYHGSSSPGPVDPIEAATAAPGPGGGS